MASSCGNTTFDINEEAEDAYQYCGCLDAMEHRFYACLSVTDHLRCHERTSGLLQSLVLSGLSPQSHLLPQYKRKLDELPFPDVHLGSKAIGQMDQRWILYAP